MTSELAIQDAIRLELGDPRKHPEIWLARNNAGQMIDQNGRRVVYGCGGKGCADLLGIWRHPPSPGHPSGIGQFIAVEIKQPTTKQTPEQLRFQELVTARGGVYVVLRSVDEARQWAEDMRRKAA